MPLNLTAKCLNTFVAHCRCGNFKKKTYLFASVELDNKATLSDHILNAVLGLLKKEVPEHGRHLQQYFNFFLMYSTIGPPEVCYLFTVVVLITYKTYAVFYCKSAIILFSSFFDS